MRLADHRNNEAAQSMDFNAISNAEFAQIEWRNDHPYSTIFDDVYFSSDDGLAETEYVFLQGNDLNHRWSTLAANTFTIIETGFGTGLNFCCAAKLWLEIAPAHAVLNFYSVEKYPLALPAITQALQLWPPLNAISLPLLAQYSELLSSGSPVLLFNQRIKLTLTLGDATEQLSQHNIKTDAWFLDGFAPSKNPEMWQSALFTQMARLSQANTTFATFTSAGVVKRGLSTAGFDVKKRVGFGKKREMLHGKWLGLNHALNHA
ncbi:MAG: tRNA (5-methylaminomethyl-2-thiouridine)(34)-methyltransferase MnmD [Methylophilaceae bacterium]